MRTRRVLAAGLAAVAAYAALAGLSGHLSPLARGPLLDGLGPPQPYRWVNPPEALASTNQQPSSAVFHVPLDAHASRPEVFVTSDDQVTIVVPKGAFDLKAGQVEVTLSVDPVDPATLSSPDKHLSVFGNAYLLQAAYRPSGDAAKLATPLDVILLYPVTTALHSTTHQVATSSEGKTWIPQKGSDSIAQQQAEAPMNTLGYAMVVGSVGSTPSTSSPTSSGGSKTSTRMVLIVFAISAGLIGIGLIFRNRGSG